MPSNTPATTSTGCNGDDTTSTNVGNGVSVALLKVSSAGFTSNAAGNREGGGTTALPPTVGGSGKRSTT